MPIGIGALTKAGIIKEGSYGAGGTADTFLELRAEDSLKNEITKIAGDFLTGSPNLFKYYHGSQDPKGIIPIVVNPDNIGLLLYMALGAEAAQEQVGTVAVYDHVFTPASAATDLDSFAYTIDRDISVFLYKGCMVNSFTMKAAKGSFLFADFDVIAKSEEDDQGSFPGISASSKKPYTFHMGTVELNGSPLAYVNSFDFTHSWNLDADGGFVLDGNDTRAHSYKTIENLTGTMELEWTSASDTFRDAYLDNTQMKLELNIVSTEEIDGLGYYYSLLIEIPIVHILGDPPTVSSRERIPFSVNFEATYDSTNFVKITHRDALSAKWSA